MDAKHKVSDGQVAHQEHREWLSQLNFCQDEIKFFQNELIKVINEHNYSFSSIETVEEYRIILLKKLQHIDDMRHVIMKHERALAFAPEMGSYNPEDHQIVKSGFIEFVRQYNVMKKNFKRFAAHND